MWNLIFHKTTGIESQNSKEKKKKKWNMMSYFALMILTFDFSDVNVYLL